MVRRCTEWLVTALVGIAAFGVTARVLDPGLLAERPGAPLAAADEAAIRATLDEFHRIYQDFFASGGGPSMLDAFPASKDVKHHVFRDVGFVRDAGLVFVQDLATSTVVGMRWRDGGLVEADVYEEWNHVLQSSAERKPVSQLKGLGQGFRYVLRRDGARWRVVAWDLADLPNPVKELEPW